MVRNVTTPAATSVRTPVFCSERWKKRSSIERPDCDSPSEIDLPTILREVGELPLELIGGPAAVVNQDAIAEMSLLARREGQPQWLRARHVVGAVENPLAQRVGREQAVGASVPVRRIVHARRMVEDRHA